MPKVEWAEVYDAISDMLKDIESWANASAEGFTENEAARMNEWLELLDRIDDMMSAETKVDRFLAL